MTIFSQVIEKIVEDVSRRQSVRSAEDVEQFYRWVRGQPKLETHVHLEAGVSPEFYSSLPQPESWKGSLPWQRAPFANLREFIFAWIDLTRSLRTLQDVEALAEAFVVARASENIRYTEAYFSPADLSFMRKRFATAPEIFDFPEVLHAYVRGLKKGLKSHPDTEVRLVMDALWPSQAAEREVMKKALAASLDEPDLKDADGSHLIVGVGLGGAEGHHEIDGHLSFLNEVREMGFKVDIHSGEGNDAALHRTSVERLSPDRVAHGFSAVEEGFVFSNNVVMCPISNLLLKTFSGRPEEHPVFRLLREDVPLLIGSDDPLLLGHDLSSEYAFIHAVEPLFTKEKFLQMQENTRARVFAPGVCKRVMPARLF